ncbi:MAG: heparan N-sulfatase, partial [Akkermansiaceae bacterium]
SFAKVLQGNIKTHRKYAFGMHNNYPEGPPYPIRSITNGEWRYIRNLKPQQLYIEKHLMGRISHNPYWQSWVFSSFSKPRNEQLINRFMVRPAEELYHTSKDSFEMVNLADDPAHQKVKQELATMLDAQLKHQGDPGIPLDSPEAHKAAAKLKPLFPVGE